MNSGCSLSKNSGVCDLLWQLTISCHQISRSEFQAVSWPVRFTTNTFSTLCLPFNASSTAGFSANADPLRKPPSAVITNLASASWIRDKSASAENPPKTTEWTAPIRAQANIATAASGIIGI